MGSGDSLENLSEFKGEILPLRMIRFEPVPAVLPESGVDWVFFGSRRGVEYFLKLIPADRLKNLRIGCIGEKTAEILRLAGLRVSFVPSRYSSTSWPDEFRERFPHAKGILFPTSDRSRFIAPPSFEENGIRFLKITVYRTICANPSWPEAEYEGIVFASPSCFDCFVEKWGTDPLYGKCLVAIGDVTANRILNAGFPCEIPDRFTMRDAIRHCGELLDNLLKKDSE